MDTNIKTLQINTFSKGMDTDTSDALLSSEAYRLANNLRYITDTESNTGELHLIEGLVDVKDLFPDFENTLDYILGQEPYLVTTDNGRYEIIAATTIRNYGVLIVYTNHCYNAQSQHEDHFDEAWFIVRLDIEKEGFEPTIVFGPCFEPLGNDGTDNGNWKNKLSLVTRWEDDDNVKVYIADGLHQIMLCNIAVVPNPMLTDISDLINSRTVTLSKPEVESTIPGTLDSSLIAYSYRLYNSTNIQTNISPTTAFYKVNKNINGINEGIPNLKKSTTGFKIKIKALASFDRVLLFRISYKESGQLPTIELIYDGKCIYSNTNPYIYISDPGRSALAELTLEEYNSASGILLSPSIIESKNDYLFAANIQYQKSKYLQEYQNWDARVVTSGDVFTVGELSIINQNGQISSSFIDNLTAEYANTNNTLSTLYNSRKWLNSASSDLSERTKLGGTGVNISYSFIIKNVVIDEYPASAGVRPYSANSHSQQVYTNPIYSASSKSLRRDELYRYGIILYSEDGYKFPVKWIADIRTPSMNAIYLEIQNNTIPNNDYWNSFTRHFDPVTQSTDKVKARVLGLKFTVNLPQGFVGYEIVRCNRGINDRATITQGVLSLLYSCADGNYNTNILFPTGIVTLKRLEFLQHFLKTGEEGESEEDYFHIKSSNLYLLFFSPEICYLPDDIKDIITNPKILPLMILHPFNSIIAAKPGQSVENGYYSPSLTGINDPSSWTLSWYLIKMDAGSNPFYYLRYLNQGTVALSEFIRNRNRLGYVKLYTYRGSSFNNGANKLNITYDILDFNISSNIPEYNSFADSSGSSLSYDTNITTLDTKSYIPWIFPYSYALDEGDLTYFLSNYDGDPSTENNKVNENTIGISERCAILKTTSSGQLSAFLYIDKDSDIDVELNYLNIFSTFLCNIRQEVTPYGGNFYSDRVNSLYYSHGQYFTSEESVVEVYDGDCFIQCFEFVPIHQWYHPKYIYHANETNIYSVPVETDIDIVNDYGSRYGRILLNPNATLLQDQPVDFVELYQLTKPLYAYNTAYSIDPEIIINSSVDETLDANYRFDNRVHYSNLKTNNEAIDSWTIFQPLNYLDVDTKHGAITGLRTFNNQLIFWQELATGLLSVNERTQITDDSNLPLILGTGGVLARYDYITTKNGMKPNQFADTLSSNVLYWWDYDSHELCAYSGGKYTILSKVKMVQNFINKQERLNKLSNIPLLTFDKKYNEIICKITDGDGHDSGSLIYNEQLLQFTSLYGVSPDFSLEYFNRVLLIKNRHSLIFGMTPAIAQWNVLTEQVDENDNVMPAIAQGFNHTTLLPYFKYVINDNAVYTKVYDNVEFAGTMYDGGNIPTSSDQSASTLSDLIRFVFNTPLKLTSKIKGNKITNRQYDFKFVIPRAGYLDGVHEWEDWKTKDWGDRLRGKTMQCEMSSTSNSVDFSLQYIITKYRISWS